MTYITQGPPPLPTARLSGVAITLIVLMWIAWLAVLLAADFLAVMMFAFADSPGAGDAAKAMIVPVFAWFGVTFVAGVLLLVFRGWWQVPLAFALAISPPFVVFAGYNLLMGKSTPTPAPPAVMVQTPPGGFVPTTLPAMDGPFKPNIKMPEQPDWQAAIKAATQSTTRP